LKMSKKMKKKVLDLCLLLKPSFFLFSQEMADQPDFSLFPFSIFHFSVALIQLYVK